MFKIIARLLPLAALLLAHTSDAGAQQQSRQPNLQLGDAVVTGFSGTVAPVANRRRPANSTAADLTFIDPDGASVRVLDVSRPGAAWDARLFAAPKKFDVAAKDVGQVFGIALDDQSPPNIYVAATSVFGLNIVSRSRDGSFDRRKKGGPGAGWMKGQFGLDLQGGPGGIYKIDGRTGVAALFANVTLDGVPNPGPGLGNIAYDAAHKQLFVSDLYTGMVHRFDLDGKELSAPFDHGVAGRGAAKLAPVPFDPRNRPNIASDRFDSEKPETWGYAPAPRRVWGVAVNGGRLYYSVTAGPQIWSVGIAPDGGVAADARLELEVPAAMGSYPISDIAFSQKGTMILAQRSGVAGSYDYSAFTASVEARVFRVWPKNPNDPPSPGLWKPEPEEYAIGFANTFRNANGGVALGYGYNSDGTLSTGACEAALWSTGQDLRNNPAMGGQLERGGPLVVHGLQANPIDALRGNNQPPAASLFVDYDGTFDDPRSFGHIGSVRILTQPCATPVAAVQPPPPPPTPIAADGGGGGRTCTQTCICPVGMTMKDGECVKTDACLPPMVMNQAGECVCPSGTVLLNGRCVPVKPRSGASVMRCTPPMVPGPNPDFCVCPAGMELNGGRCVQVQANVCKAPMVLSPCDSDIDVRIDKTGATSPPPDVPWYSWTLTVTNVKDPFNGNGIITVTDNAPAGMTFSPPTPVPASDWNCSASTSTSVNCIYIGSGPTGTGQVIGTITIVAQATGKGPYPPFTNCATVGVTSGTGYHDDNAGDDQSCATVTKPGQVGELIVKKQVVYVGPTLLPPAIYPVNVVCGSNTTTLNLSSDGTPQTVSNIPYGTNCSVNEPTPPVPPGVCPPNTTGTWGISTSPSTIPPISATTTTVTVTNTLTCEKKDGGTLVIKKIVDNTTNANVSSTTYPATVTCGGNTTPITLTDGGSQTVSNVPAGTTCTVNEPIPPNPSSGCTPLVPIWLPPQYSPSSVVIPSSGTVTITVTNPLRCERDSSVAVVKQVINNTSADLSSVAYPVTLTCTSGGSTFTTNFNLTDGIPGMRNNSGINVTCTAAETLPPAPTTGCPAGQTPTWVNSPTYNPPSVTTAYGVGSVLTVVNTLNCVPTKIGSCMAPMVPVPGAIGQCMCPSGTKLTDGKCVPISTCKPPMISGATPGACVCPDGKVQRGGRCVEPVTCVAPATLNKAGTACNCPEGMSKKGNTCVEREKKKERKKKKTEEREQPRITPRDVIRGFPGGGFGPGRGGGGGGGAPGGGGGGKR